MWPLSLALGEKLKFILLVYRVVFISQPCCTHTSLIIPAMSHSYYEINSVGFC